MWYKVKIRPADKLMSQFVRQRDKMLCQYNFQCFKGTAGNQASHFQKRRHENVRFDPQNVDWVCGKYHYFVENDPNGQKTLEAWKFNQLGEIKYKLLMIRTHTFKKKDDTMQLIILKALLND